MTLPQVPGHVPYRSNEGCWTCRLRKKKCDENRPNCRTCQTRGLECHGYGSKPVWMDSPDTERIHREKIKRTVKESYRKRRLGVERQSATAVHPSPPTSIPSVDSSQRNDNNISDWPPDDRAFQETETLPLLHLEEIIDPSYLATPANTTSTEVSSHCPILSSPRPGNGTTHQQARDEDLNNGRHEHCNSDGGNRRNGRALLLISHFHDSIFDSLFPVYALRPHGIDRGWLPLFTADQGCVYFASLAVTSIFRNRMPPSSQHRRSPNEGLKDYEIFNSTAIQTLSKELERYVTDHVIVPKRVVMCSMLLLSILELIIAAIIKGASGEWEIHVEAVSRLSLLDFLVSAPTLFVDFYGLSLGKGFDRSSLEDESCGTYPSRSFLVAQYIWFDIVSSISSRTPTRLHVDFKQILSDQTIDYVQVIGLPRGVLLSLVDICELEQWTSYCRERCKLSVRELAERAARIEEKLEECMRDMAVTETNQWDPCNTLMGLLTPVFGAAALIYLHVVVSGPFPELPEISCAVQKVLEALRSVPHIFLLRSVAWPLCVAGSMSHDSQSGEFVDLMAGIESAVEVWPTTQTSLAVVRECWRQRAAGNTTSDWSDGLKSLGCPPLL